MHINRQYDIQRSGGEYNFMMNIKCHYVKAIITISFVNLYQSPITP